MQLSRERCLEVKYTGNLGSGGSVIGRIPPMKARIVDIIEVIVVGRPYIDIFRGLKGYL